MAINIELIKSLNGRAISRSLPLIHWVSEKSGIRLVSLTILRQRER